MIQDVYSKKQLESDEREKKNLQKQIGSLNKEKERVFTAFRRGILKMDDFEKVMKEIKGKINSAKTRLAEIEKSEVSQK
ncbi:peptidoglycan hydrolase CwlO-like protein [Desulfohalotomaculum tongense]|uniref:hypothetical protein n=1 Tax=Desulforadius tongensis TaxID=1216062 RepID=UPI001956A254|nr:hypothetical protein [Desulforadius tongensis]MBM7855423.1 peptidoglycan hydrolase CwlO-like protein [Desulforadius tongensis]